MDGDSRQEDRVARERWDKIYREVPPEDIPWDEGQPSDILVDLVRQGKVKKGAALDICCGTGHNTLFLAQEGFQVAGIDISPTAVSAARERCQQAGVSCQLEPGNAVRLPYPDNSFDLVFDRGCFHHIPPQEREAFIQGVRRVLKEGGKYQLICFSNKDQWAPQSFSREQIRELFSPLFLIESLKAVTFRESSSRATRHFYSALMEKKDVHRDS